MFLTTFRKGLFFLTLSVVSLLFLAAPTVADYAVLLGLVTDEECRVSYRVEDGRSLLDDLEVWGEISPETGQCLVKMEAMLHFPSPVTGFGVEIVDGTARVRKHELLLGGRGNDYAGTLPGQMELTLEDTPGAEGNTTSVKVWFIRVANER